MEFINGVDTKSSTYIIFSTQLGPPIRDVYAVISQSISSEHRIDNILGQCNP